MAEFRGDHRPDRATLLICGVLGTLGALPILLGRTLFPRWFALFIPIFPTVAALGIGFLRPGFFDGIGPFIASGCMVFAFGGATVFQLVDPRGRSWLG